MSVTWSKKKVEFYKKLASILSLALAVFLTVLKIFASLSTGSLAILSSFVDSLSDIFASFVSFVAVRFSLKSPSCAYRYGYFKAESISALIQSAFIAGSGLFVFYSSVDRLLHPTALEHTFIGILVMMLSLILTLGLVIFQKYVSKKTNSFAIEADSAHYVTDIITNMSVIFSLWAVSVLKQPLIDTLTAFCVSVYLVNYAYRIAVKAISLLMDHELPENVRQDVAHLIKNTEGIKGFHDFRTRDLGGVYFFEIHLEMDKDISLLQAHDLAEKVESKILEKFSNAQVIIHQDPYGIKEKRLDDVLENCHL